MFKFKIIMFGLVGVLSVSCSHFSDNKTDPLRNIASEELTRSGVGNQLLRSCLGNLDEELDTVALSNKFKVVLVGDDTTDLNGAPRVKDDARNLCYSKTKAFRSTWDSCSVSVSNTTKGRGKKEFTATAEPEVSETFIKNYRKNILCNRLAVCEQKASLDDNISSNTLDKIHRLYEINKCDSITIDVIENKIIKYNPQVDSDNSTKISNGKTGAQLIDRSQSEQAVVSEKHSPPSGQPAGGDDAVTKAKKSMCRIASDEIRCNLNEYCQWTPPRTQARCIANPSINDNSSNAKFKKALCPASAAEANCNLNEFCTWLPAEKMGICSTK